MMRARATLLPALILLAAPCTAGAGWMEQRGSKSDLIASPGSVLTRFGHHPTSANALAVQADGKVLVAGTRGNNHRTARFAIVRYTNRGKVDRSFGKRVIAFGAPASALALAVQPDGKIIAAGAVRGSGVSLDKFPADFAVARLHANGRLDGSFGTGGRTRFDLGADDEIAEIELQPDGSILVTGSTVVSTPGSLDSRSSLAMIRLTSAGAVDPAFGTGGRVITPFERYVTALDATVQANGRISVAGVHYDNQADPFAGTQIAMARYDAAGTPDASFGTGGKLTVPLVTPADVGSAPIEDTGVSAAAFDPAGRLVVAGGVRFTKSEELDQTRLLQFDADGARVPGFGANGSIGYRQPVVGLPNAIETDASGRIVISGLGGPGRSTSHWRTSRFSPSGVLDRSFARDGSVRTQFLGLNEEATEIAFDPFGRTVVAGYADPGYRSAFAVARYRPFGRADKAFGGSKGK